VLYQLRIHSSLWETKKRESGRKRTGASPQSLLYSLYTMTLVFLMGTVPLHRIRSTGLYPLYTISSVCTRHHLYTLWSSPWLPRRKRQALSSKSALYSLYKRDLYIHEKRPIYSWKETCISMTCVSFSWSSLSWVSLLSLLRLSIESLKSLFHESLSCVS